jgi:hypothetical protein
MTRWTIFPGWLSCGVLALLALGAMPSARAAELKLEAQLIWGTNDKSSPDPAHKPVGTNTQQRLKSLPFKWANYFEVNRQKFSVVEGGTNRVTMSKECEIRVKNLGNNTVEVVLLGKGKSVGCIKQVLPKGELLVTGGNAENLTAWFVVLKQTD